MMGTMPFVTVLLALRQEIALAMQGVQSNGRPVIVRHHRHRESKPGERPCFSIRMISDDVSQLGRQTTDEGMPEMVMELSVNLSLDLDLDPESSDPADLTGDPTGFGEHARLMQIAIDRLLPGPDHPPNTIGGTTWDIRYEGTAPEEADAEPDAARLEERLVLLYRVRADQPTILLMES